MQTRHNTALAATLALTLFFMPSCSRAPKQTTYASPEEASAALLQALKSDDVAKLKAIFGPDALQASASGDPVSDRHDREVVAFAMEQVSRWTSRGENEKELIVGYEQWPFPAPLVKVGNQWQFDAEAGKEEVLARRIGRNEMSVIDLCRVYVEMQNEYASQPHDGKPAGLFATRLRSNPNRQDGLYWPVKAGQRPSPLGDLAAEADAEGYDKSKPSSPSPFWGYHFRILTAQGAAAPGGKKSYIVNGNMSEGFALLAFPAKYGSSGVMTFMVSRDGTVMESDLGADTPNAAARLTEYNPDSTWKPVQTP